ncbi:MAG TPA: SgcJ/EcaC family oxidoreductase [Patescibacteria group bacterium]|nr:SgcJ/EcaC family oxidoreductase [Patescibacteria group bacterium]
MKKSLFALFMLIFLGQGCLPQSQPSPFGGAEKKALVDAVASILQKQYVFPDTARKMGELIRKNLKAGKYAVLDDPRAFAIKLTEDLRSISRDKHLGVRFAPESIRDEKTTDEAARKKAREFQKKLERADNYGFKEIKILSGNVGYLKFNYFSAAQEAFRVAVGAMAFLANCDALIIDLRENGGGAHPVRREVLNDQFFIMVPYARAVNPVSKTNWEGTGIEPDVKVPASLALAKARTLALEKLAAGEKDERIRTTYQWALDGLKAQCNPVTLSEETLKSYAGEYGPRKISFENGSLFYQRENGAKMKMIPMSEDYFVFGEIEYFRLKIVRKDGRVTGVEGRYDNGTIDANPRQITHGVNMAASESRQAADLAAIEKLHQTDMAAAKIHDIKTLITLWTDDGILFLPGREPIRGKAAIWKYLQEQLPESQKYEISEYQQRFEEVQVLGDWAYEWGNFSGTYRLKGGGPDMHERARLFRILRRQPDGSWKCHRAFAQDLPGIQQ